MNGRDRWGLSLLLAALVFVAAFATVVAVTVNEDGSGKIGPVEYCLPGQPCGR